MLFRSNYMLVEVRTAYRPLIAEVEVLAVVEAKGLLGNEITLLCGEKRLRCDSILYNKVAQPQMIIEYKAPTVAVTQRVFNQISVYNLLLHVDYLVVSNGLQHYCCRMDYDHQSYQFLDEIPPYPSL